MLAARELPPPQLGASSHRSAQKGLRVPERSGISGRAAGFLTAGTVVVIGWVMTYAKDKEYICAEPTSECLVEVDTAASRFGLFLIWVGLGLAVITGLATSRHARASRLLISAVAVLALALGSVQALTGGTTLEDHRAERERQAEVDRLLREALAPKPSSSPSSSMPSPPPSAFVFDHGWADVVRSAPEGGCVPATNDCRTVRVELTHACTSNVVVAGQFVRDGRWVDAFSSSPRGQDRDGPGRFSRELPLGVRDLPADVEARITSVRCQSWAGGDIPPNGTALRGHLP